MNHDNIDEALSSGLFETQHPGAYDGGSRHALVSKNELWRKSPPGPYSNVGAPRALLDTEPVPPHLFLRGHPQHQCRSNGTRGLRPVVGRGRGHSDSFEHVSPFTAGKAPELWTALGPLALSGN